MLTQEDYNKAHKEFPFALKYQNTPDNCNHNYNFIVFCNNKWDIIRCQKCGSEIERSCNFDYDYD